jgi:hypothetical protein
MFLNWSGMHSNKLEGFFMDASIFLARVYGLYFIIMAALLLIKSDYCVSIIRDLFQNSTLVFAIGWSTLILGILVVIGHNIWELNWKTIITVFGYLTLLKGVALLYFPEIMKRYNFSSIRNVHFVLYGTLFVLGILIFYLSF